jgi:hypothetical protein
MMVAVRHVRNNNTKGGDTITTVLGVSFAIMERTEGDRTPDEGWCHSSIPSRKRGVALSRCPVRGHCGGYLSGFVMWNLGDAPIPGPLDHTVVTDLHPVGGEAFFTTDLPLSWENMLRHDCGRWTVELTMRNRNAFDGLGQDQCRKVRGFVGANTCHLVMATARTVWCLEHIHRPTTMHLRHSRPWDRQKCAPSQLDMAWAYSEALHVASVFPLKQFVHILSKIMSPQEGS